MSPNAEWTIDSEAIQALGIIVDYPPLEQLGPASKLQSVLFERVLAPKRCLAQNCVRVISSHTWEIIN